MSSQGALPASGLQRPPVWGGGEGGSEGPFVQHGRVANHLAASESRHISPPPHACCLASDQLLANPKLTGGGAEGGAVERVTHAPRLLLRA